MTDTVPLAPAAQPANSFMNQAQSIAIYAQNRHNELLAQLRFMGLLVGIRGPNDTDADVTNARESIIEALSDFLANDNGPLSEQANNNFRQYLAMRDANLYDRFGSDEASIIYDHVSSIGRMGHPADLGGYMEDVAGGSFQPNYSPQVDRGLLSPEGASYIDQAHAKYQTAAQQHLEMRRIAAERRRQWWASVWSNLRSYYDARIAEIKEGRVLEAVTKTAIDAAYFAAEELIFSGMIAAIVALTGGAAAAIGVGLRIALSVASRSARVVAAGTNVVRAAGRQAADTLFTVRVTKVEPDVIPGTGSPGRQLHTHEVDVEHDLTPDEATAFGEGGLGSTRTDADAPEQGPNGPRPRATERLTRGQNENEITYDPETGRPVSATGTLREDFGGSARGDNATAVGRLGNPGDHGGHLVAHRFMGDTPDYGIVPQAGNLNTGAWKKMENDWADAIARGYEVDYDINVVPPGATRPDRFRVRYNVRDPETGEIVQTREARFRNQAGETFDRTVWRDN